MNIGAVSQDMIHNLYVFDENGTPLLSVKVGSIETDSVLLTGFLSAMESFSKKISQSDVEQINVKDYKFYIRRVGSVYVALVADTNDRDVEPRMEAVTNIIRDSNLKFDDGLVEAKIREVLARKQSATDKAKRWANIGL
jgi:hypothetical protein